MADSGMHPVGIQTAAARQMQGKDTHQLFESLKNGDLNEPVPPTDDPYGE